MTNHHNLWCTMVYAERCVTAEFLFHDKCITSFVGKASANGWKLILDCFSAQYTIEPCKRKCLMDAY